MRLLLIGGGNMGGAIVRGAIVKRVMPARDISVVEVDDAKREALRGLGCVVAETPIEIADRVSDSTQIMLAVKPQMFTEATQSLHDAELVGGCARVVISVMAGIASGRIHHALGPGTRVVRCMPNTPCQVGAGMTAVSLGMGARDGDEILARSLFDALGLTVVLDESLMDAVTAVSASGPAYVFLLAEAMQQAAEAVDLPHDVAKALVTQTIVGAGAMLNQPRADAAALRAAVTSPRGTTAAAVDVLKRREFEQAMIEAITAARDRGRELGKS